MSSTASRASSVERTAGAVGVALLQRDLGALTTHEVAVADDAVRRGVRALPDSTLVGVTAAAVLCRAMLLAHARRPFLSLAPEKQQGAVEVLTRRPLPVVAEFVKLTRGLALVAVVDERHRCGQMG